MTSLLSEVFWLYGRSGAGKTTLAQRLRDGLTERGISAVHLDGDELRSTLSSDLGFKPEARLENHRRIAEIAKLLATQGLTVVVSTMAPEYSQRDLVAQILGRQLTWFYIHAPLELCMARDPKGLYQRALEGKVKQLLNYPFDAPRPRECQHLINTSARTVAESYQEILEVVENRLNHFTRPLLALNETAR